MDKLYRWEPHVLMPQAAPALLATLLFWLLGCYVLTRGGGTLVALIAVAWQVATAAFFLGETMKAHAPSLEQWLPWARDLRWGPILSQPLFLWLALLMLHDLRLPSGERFLHRAGYPLGIASAVLAAGLVVAVYLGDALYAWSAAHAVPVDQAGFDRFGVPPGPLYPGFLALRLLTGAGTVSALWLGWRRGQDIDERRHFGWILLGEALASVGSASLVLAQVWSAEWWPSWASHLILIVALTVVVVNVAAYSLLVQGQVLKTDLAYFASSAMAVTLLFAGAVVLTLDASSQSRLLTLIAVLLLAILLHAAADLGRRAWDQLLLAPRQREIRQHAALIAQHAVTDPPTAPQESVDSTPLDSEIRSVREALEVALRSLNRSSRLAESRLLYLLPCTLVAGRSGPGSDSATPVERAHLLREALLAGLERTRPPAGDASSQAALEYHVLHDEFVLERPNRWIMSRYAISARTFYRLRLRAIASLATELAQYEARLGAAVEAAPSGATGAAQSAPQLA